MQLAGCDRQRNGPRRRRHRTGRRGGRKSVGDCLARLIQRCDPCHEICCTGTERHRASAGCSGGRRELDGQGGTGGHRTIDRAGDLAVGFIRRDRVGCGRICGRARRGTSGGRRNRQRARIAAHRDLIDGADRKGNGLRGRAGGETAWRGAEQSDCEDGRGTTLQDAFSHLIFLLLLFLLL